MPGRRPNAMRAAAAACSVMLLAPLSACGAETPEPGSEAGWTEQRIRAAPGADNPVGLAADGEDVLVTVLGEDGMLESHLSYEGGEFVRGEPFAGDAGFPGFADPVRQGGTWWLVGSGGREEVDGDDELLFEPRVLRSEDGLTWESVDVSGITGPVEITAVVVADEALVAVGTRRPTDQTSSEGFSATTWRSEDGARWAEAALPGVVPDPSYEDQSHASAVVSSGDRLLVAGALARRAAVWASDDAGQSWRKVTADPVSDLYSVSGLVADGSTVLASGSPRGSESGSLVLRSDDGGDTWAEPGEQPATEGEGSAPLWAGGGQFFTVSRPGFDPFGDPEVCYADLDACSVGSEADVTLVHHSADGEEWGVLDVPDPDTGAQLVGVVSTSSGRVLVAHLVPGGVEVNAWPSGADLPDGKEPGAAPRVGLVTVPEGSDPEPGVRYHAPLYVHCGMDWLYLGGRPWQRTDDGPSLETGAGDEVPEGWPVAGQTVYGYATLRTDGVVEYSIGGGDAARTIATYGRTGVRPPGCD